MPPHSCQWIQNLISLKQLQRLALLPGNDSIMDSYFRGMTESTPHKHRIVDQILDVSSIPYLVENLPNLRHLEVGIKGQLFRHDFSIQQQFYRLRSLRLVCSSKLQVEDGVKPLMLWMHFFTTFRNVVALHIQADKNPNISWVHISAAINAILHELELLDLSTNNIGADQLYFFVPRLRKLKCFITPYKDFGSPRVEAISNPNENFVSHLESFIGAIQNDGATLLASKLPYLKYITTEQNKIVKLHRLADHRDLSLEPVQPRSSDWHEAMGTKYFQLDSSQEMLYKVQQHCIHINKHIQQQKKDKTSGENND